MAEFDLFGEGGYKNFVDKNTRENVKVWDEIDVEGRTFAHVFYEKVTTDEQGNPMSDAIVEANPTTYIKRDNMYFKRAIGSNYESETVTNFSQITGTNKRIIEVTADETNGGEKTFYLHDGANLHWLITQLV